jgi:predicted lipid-binding transport protein (Tim44 family)
MRRLLLRASPSARPRGSYLASLRSARRKGRPWLWALALLLVFCAVAWARPGGGSSFSGGSGGGSDDFFILDLIFFVLEILIDYPQIGFPLLGALILAWVVWKAWQSDTGRIILGVAVLGGQVTLLVLWPAIGLGVAGAAVLMVGVAAVAGFLRKRPPEWSTAVESAPAATSQRVRTPRRQLESLRRADPDFSVVVLEDFLDALYVEVQHARAHGLERLQAYLKPEARVVLAGDLSAVTDVIVGALHIRSFNKDKERARLEVEFESNLTEVARDQSEQSYYLRDRWTLSRRIDAHSRPPDKARIFQCPNCAAALEGIAGGKCSYCNQQVDTGDHDWIVERVHSLSRESRGPILTEMAPEQGTDLPTVLDADVDRARDELARKDPAFTQAALAQRIRLIFETMQVAWSTREWLKARPYLSDRLFQAQLYWIEAYKRAKLRNLNEQTVITKSQLVRVTSDKYFDGITVRIYAQSLDYVVDDEGKLICGSKSEPRRYSEYWTLIRGAKVRGAPRGEPNCPNCGAPLDVNLAGNCAHCKARVTLGEFDWVLSRIEQDEVYGG